MSQEVEKRKLADELFYEDLRKRGFSHDEAILKIYETRISLEKESVSNEQINLNKEHENLDSDTLTPEYQETVAYYRGKAFKNLIQLVIFIIAIYFVIQNSITKGTPITIDIMFSACGILSIITIFFIIMGLCIRLLGNYILGGIAGLLAIAFLLDKLSAIQIQYNISDETFEFLFCAIPVTYFLYNFISLIINIKNSISS